MAAVCDNDDGGSGDNSGDNADNGSIKICALPAAVLVAAAAAMFI